MNNSTNLSLISRITGILLTAFACFQQVEAAITSTDCAANGGVENFGICYVVDETGHGSWSAAETFAQGLDSSFHLVSIHSAAENTYVNSLFTTASSYWIGLYDAAVDDTFAWIDGSSFDYSNWASGQPAFTTGTVDFGLYDISLNGWAVTSNGTLQVSSVFSAPISGVPVPAAAWLFGSGLIGLAGVARKNRNSLLA
jgi:hypothetical protein